MGKVIQLKNKKYAKLSADEAEARQRIANHKERQRQSNMSDALKSMKNLISTQNDGKKQRSQLSIVLDTIDYIKDIQRELREAQILVAQLQGLQTMSSLSSLLSGCQPGVLDTQPMINHSSVSQLQHQIPGNNYPSNKITSHFSTGRHSERYQISPTLSSGFTGVVVPHGGYNYQPSLPYFSMDRSNTTAYQHHTYGDDNESGPLKIFDSCKLKSKMFGPAMTDYMCVGTQQTPSQTSTNRFPASSTTPDQFHPAGTSYLSSLYRQL